MNESLPSRIALYISPVGKAPFTDWLINLRDRRAIARIKVRVDRLQMGNRGDCKPVGTGVYELRVDFGPGYRVYFGQSEKMIILLLCGGDKSTQSADIERAKAYWADYQERKIRQEQDNDQTD